MSIKIILVTETHMAKKRATNVFTQELAIKKSSDIWMPKRTQRQSDGKRLPHLSKHVS